MTYPQKRNYSIDIMPQMIDTDQYERTPLWGGEVERARGECVGEGNTAYIL